MSVIVWPGDDQDVEFTITSDTDISGDTVEVSLGSWTVPPGTWFAPLSTTFSNAGKTCVIVLRVGNGYLLPSPAQVYFPWYRITAGGVVTRMDRQLLRIDVRDATGSPIGTQGPFVESIVAGTNVTVNSADPLHPIVSATAGAGGVTTFNTRAGVVSLTKADVTGTGLAAADVGAATTAALASEITRATTAEGTNTTAISSEATTARAAESANATAITNEATTARAAEALKLAKASNLSDLASAATARTNLGLGTAAVAATTDFDAAGAAATETTRATAAEALKLAKTSNLSDVASAATARTNLGLGTAAVVNTGTTTGTVPLLGASGTVAVAQLATGTPTGAKFVRDDGTLATPAGGGAPYLTGSTSGFYYSPASIGAPSASNGTVGLLICHPLWLAAGTLDRIEVQAFGSATAGETVRLGIYSDNGHGYPGALLIDGGSTTADLSTIARKFVSISQAVTAGLYWPCLVRQGATATTTLVVNAPLSQTMPTAVSTSGALYNTACVFTQTGVTGALPTPFTATPTLTALGGNTPWIWVRYA